MKEIMENLKSKKLKITPQRLAIYNMLYNTTSHPTAEAIHSALSCENPTLSLATVYKTLCTLKTHGLVQELNVGDESSRYDANVSSHSHIICNICGEVMDYHTSLDLNSYTKSMEEKTGFHLESTKLYFYGTCKSCYKTSQIAE